MSAAFTRPNPFDPVALGRRARLIVFAAALAPAALAVPPDAARAQVAQAWMYDTPVEPYRIWRGARVQAMGDLRAAVEDDRNPLSPYADGNNPAGFLTVRDTSWAEQSSSYEDYFDSFYGRYHSVVSRSTAFRFGWDRGAKWALGADVRLGKMDASRHDLGTVQDRSRFIRDFDMAVPDYFIPRTGDRTLGAGVETPYAALSYARRFRSWLTGGGRFAHRSEQEDRRVLFDEYDFDNHSTSTELAGGVLLHPAWLRETAEIGLYGSWTGDKVKGISSTPFNEDSYDWSRPLVTWGLQAFVHRGGARGLIEGRHYSFDGEQIARVNWAPQFFLNPYPSEVNQDFIFKKTWTSATSGLRHNEASTQWMVDVPSTPLHVGARWRYYREYEWVRPIPDVLSPMLPLDVRRLGYQGAGGVSFDVGEDEGTVAMEVQLGREHRADWAEERGAGAPATNVPDIVIGEVSYHFGAEFKPRPWLPLRAGVALRRYDPDRRDGEPPYRGIRLSAGFAYRWTALGVLLDGAFAHEHFRRVPLDLSNEIGSSDNVQFSVQHLF